MLECCDTDESVKLNFTLCQWKNCLVFSRLNSSAQKGCEKNPDVKKLRGLQTPIWIEFAPNAVVMLQ